MSLLSAHLPRAVQDVGDGLEQEYYATVTTQALETRLCIKLKPHPDKVSEAAALSSVQLPNLHYTLGLPKEILRMNNKNFYCGEQSVTALKVLVPPEISHSASEHFNTDSDSQRLCSDCVT
jgi:hypothetical protein